MVAGATFKPTPSSVILPKIPKMNRLMMWVFLKNILSKQITYCIIVNKLNIIKKNGQHKHFVNWKH